MTDKTPFKYAQANDSPGFLLWQATMLWQQAITRVLKAFSITQTQYAIFASTHWLELHGRTVTQATLAAHSKTDKMTISKAIRQLEKRGLVLRVKSSADARTLTVTLSPKGKKLVGKAIPAVECADERFFKTLTPLERQRILAMMTKLIAMRDS